MSVRRSTNTHTQAKQEPHDCVVHTLRECFEYCLARGKIYSKRAENHFAQCTQQIRNGRHVNTLPSIYTNFLHQNILISLDILDCVFFRTKSIIYLDFKYQLVSLFNGAHCCLIFGQTFQLKSNEFF